jgi:hypothetical protein
MSVLLAAAPFNEKGLLQLRAGRRYKIIDFSGDDTLTSADVSEPLSHDQK